MRADQDVAERTPVVGAGVALGTEGGTFVAGKSAEIGICASFEGQGVRGVVKAVGGIIKFRGREDEAQTQVHLAPPHPKKQNWCAQNHHNKYLSQH